MSSRTDIEKHLVKIEEIFKYEREFRANYGDKAGDMIKRVAGFMGAQLKTSWAGEAARATDEEKSRVNEAMVVMLDVILYKPIVDMTRDLSISLAAVASCWNSRVGGVPDVERNSHLLERVVTMTKTLDDTIKIVSKLTERATRELARRPVAYELSKHYLESLK